MFDLFEATRRSLLSGLALAPMAGRGSALAQQDGGASRRGLEARQDAGIGEAVAPILRALQQKVAHLPVSPEEFGAIGDGKADDSAALQRALDSGRPVMLRSAKYHIGDTGLLVRHRGTHIIGNNAEIHYSGPRSALDISPEVERTGWLTNCVFQDFSIYCHASSIGIRWRFSYSLAINVSVALYHGRSVGWLIDVDYKAGTGPYYNLFANCHVQGRAFLPGMTDQYGWKFTSYPEASTRGPNANTWIGGRTSGCTVNHKVLGSGNAFIRPTSETVPAGGWHFRFENEHCPTAAGNTGNCVYHPYLEGQDGANGFFVGQNAYGTVIQFDYVTSIGRGIALEDRGRATSIQTFDGIYMPNVGSSNARTLDWYEEDLFVPTLAGLAVAGNNKYARQYGSYTRIGNLVHCDIAIKLARKDSAMAGPITIDGLPFQSSATNTSSAAVSVATLNLGVGYTQVGGIVNESQKRLLLVQTVLGKSSSIPEDAVTGTTELILSVTYRV